MKEGGIDLTDAKPQLLTHELAAGAALLVTMGCGESCPVVPGLRRADWPLEDPKGKPLDVVRGIRDDIRGRVEKLVAEEDVGARETEAGLQGSLNDATGSVCQRRVDLSTMSRNVSVLQREGYVVRTRHAGDSRVVAVILTRKGANALETLRCDEKDVMAKLYSRIPAASRAATLQALELVQLVLEPDAGVAAPCCADDQPKRAAR